MLRVVFARAVSSQLALAAIQGCGSADAPNVDRPKPICGKVVPDGGGGIEVPEDGSLAPDCQTSLCNYQSQDGCAADETCTPPTTKAALEPVCAPTGKNPRGAACSSLTPCEHGEACAEGYCRKLCCAGDWTVCDEGESCFRTLGSGAWVCYPTGECSVLDPHPAACKDTEDCKIVDSRGSEACVPKSAGELGEPCSAASGRLCGAGLTCVGQPGSATCRRLCRAEECGEPACQEGEGACVHLDRDPPGVGECTPGW